MKTTAILTAAIGSFLLSSCASKFTAAQREALSTVAVAPVSVKSDAYSEPYGGDRGAASNAALTGTSSGTGAIGGVVGSLVGESIAASQNGIFKAKNKQYFPAIKGNTPEISGPIGKKLGADLKADPFFGSRLRESSPNQITGNVTSYGLVRSGKGGDGNLLMTPRVIIDLALRDAGGKKLVGRNYVGTGYNHPVTKYASDAGETRTGYEMAIRVAIDQFTSELSRKSAE